jgi:YHS domain-containing protein
MKWIVLMLALALTSGAMIAGCEKAEDTTAPTAVPSTPTTDEAIDAAPTTAPATQASAALTVSNQYCAVDQEHKVDPKVTVAHAGKTIGFCCKDCIPTFEKEPAKYLATLK